jgi:alkylhydroperoxidase family enzyme
MSLIKTMEPDTTEGKIGEIFEMFRRRSGLIPGPLQMLSASPGLFEVYSGTFGYWVTHPSLGRDLLNCIRHGVAVQHCISDCVVFNEAILRTSGMDESELAALREDPDTAPLEDRERSLLRFVLRSVKEPGSATQADMDGLHAQGWTPSGEKASSQPGCMPWPPIICGP